VKGKSDFVNHEMSGKHRAKNGLYTLDVFIISGPIAAEFARRNQVISRTIQIRGDQNLEDLHRTIFGAFDREEDHMYEFQIGGKRPMDPKARRYVLPPAMGGSLSDRKPFGDVTRTTVGALGLKKGDAFGYWFDFGDDWWHQINVVAIEDQVSGGKYPKVVRCIGESPPQYIDGHDER
jgi:Plasmid pRiA4b ORF-3-like protein